MSVLIATLAHDRHGVVQMRVESERDVQGYLNHGWRLIGFERWTRRLR